MESLNQRDDVLKYTWAHFARLGLCDQQSIETIFALSSILPHWTDWALPEQSTPTEITKFKTKIGSKNSISDNDQVSSFRELSTKLGNFKTREGLSYSLHINQLFDLLTDLCDNLILLKVRGCGKSKRGSNFCFAFRTTSIPLYRGQNQMNVTQSSQEVKEALSAMLTLMKNEVRDFITTADEVGVNNVQDSTRQTT